MAWSHQDTQESQKEATDKHPISCPYSQNHLSNYYSASDHHNDLVCDKVTLWKKGLQFPSQCCQFVSGTCSPSAAREIQMPWAGLRHNLGCTYAVFPAASFPWQGNPMAFWDWFCSKADSGVEQTCEPLERKICGDSPWPVSRNTCEEEEQK